MAIRNRSDRDIRHDRAGRGEEEWFARSLSQAAYVYLHQVPLLRIDGSPGAARFWFLDKDQLARRMGDEYNNGGRVEAAAYSQAMQQLKKEASAALGKLQYQGGNIARGLSGESGNQRGTLIAGQEQQSDSDFAQQFAAAMGER